MTSREKRAREIQASIREILIREWDPIHIQDVPDAQDEYDGYVGSIYRLLAAAATESEVAEHLAFIERDSMGFSASAEALLPVARRLRELDVRLTPA